MRAIWGNRAVTVCIPAHEFFFFGEVTEGKFLRADFFAASSPKEAIDAALCDGFSCKNLTVAATFPEFRTKFAVYPDMPEAELFSTLFWESDVLFRMQDPVMKYTVLSHSPDGYRLLCAAVPEPLLSSWQEAAKSLKCKISCIRAIFPPVPKEIVSAYFLCGKKSARVLLAKDGVWHEAKRLDLGDEEGRSLLLEETGNFFWFPMADCDAETREAWHLFLHPEEADVSRETWEKELYFTLAKVIAGGASDFDFIENTDTKFKPENLLKGSGPYMCAAAMSLCLVLGFSAEYGVAYLRLSEVKAAQEAFLPKISAMRAARARETERAEAIKECQAYFKESGDWQRKLVTLADVMPQGATISSIEAGSGIVITGTAAKGEDVSELSRLLSLSWDMQVRRGEVKRDGLSPLLRFTLRAEKEAAHGKEK